MRSTGSLPCYHSFDLILQNSISFIIKVARLIVVRKDTAAVPVDRDKISVIITFQTYLCPSWQLLGENYPGGNNMRKSVEVETVK